MNEREIAMAKEVMAEAKKPMPWPKRFRAWFSLEDAVEMAKQNHEEFVDFCALSYGDALLAFTNDNEDMALDFLRDRGEVTWA